MTNKIAVEVGKVYLIDNQKYLIDEIGFNKVYGFQVNESGKVHGRRRILGSLKKKEVKSVD